jgi:uncharacterized protein YndB with AHSA1/START domain
MSPRQQATDTTHREIVVSRLIDVPVARIGRAWTDPAELGLWFGPQGFETIHAKLDFRPGGTYH